ncbi:hypothetical protein BH11MYX4_BH11MYX4_51470 [soil metagenome]
MRCRACSTHGHGESYFLKLNDREGRRALWIKATILVHEGGAPRVAEAWAIAFDREGRHVAAKQVVPLAQAHFGGRGLDVTVAGLRITPGRVSGEVVSHDQRIAFDLRFTMTSPPLVPFPSERMYEARLPSSKLVSPHPDSRFSGTYTAAGQTVEVDGWHGMQGHNWGTRHAELYAWSHCNEWQGEDDLVLEGVTARVKVGPALAPPLTIVCVRHRGVRYDFNAPLTLLRARGTIELRRWTFSAKSALATASGELWADTRDFVGLAYENPDGAITYCLNSKIARGRIRLSVRGKPDVEALTRAAALEVGTKDPEHGVTMLA